MRKLLFFVPLVIAVCIPPLKAANFKLYMKDGSYQLVREYKVDGDRVRFYAVERSEWEEVPLTLVDLKHTQANADEAKAVQEKAEQADADERDAAREEHAEMMKIPRDPGVYQLENGQLRVFPLGESSIRNSKGRNVLKALSPVPLIPGKSTLELTGEHSPNIVKDASPEFFIQLANFESFGIIRLEPQKGFRIIEQITIEPITKEMEEKRDTVQVFTKQLTDNGLFKIWAQDPLPQGEYAVIEYMEGKVNPQVWDFRIQ